MDEIGQDVAKAVRYFWTTRKRQGAFKPSARPWLGYPMLLEDCPRTNAAVGVKAPHFPVFDEFRNASYAGRYELLILRLLRERLYDGACLLVSDAKGGLKGNFREPNSEIGIERFIASLAAHASACMRMKR
jgi:hypothetical protein